MLAKFFQFFMADNSFDPQLGWFLMGQQGIIDEAKKCLKWAPRALDKFIMNRKHNGSAKTFFSEAETSFQAYLNTMMEYEQLDLPKMVLLSAVRALISLTNLSAEMKSLTDLIPEKVEMDG